MLTLDTLRGQTFTVRADRETWQVAVKCPQADLVYLVAAMPDGSTLWSLMHKGLDERWHADLDLREGEYQFRYFVAQGSSMVSGGATGLTAARIQTRHSAPTTLHLTTPDQRQRGDAFVAAAS